MTKEQALFNFYNQFLPAYERSNVPSDVEFPYLTYNLTTDSSLEYSVRLEVNLWYKSTSLREINAKTNEISRAIGYKGVMLTINNGYIWIRKGSPFAQTMDDPNDDLIRRKYIILEADFLCAD